MFVLLSVVCGSGYAETLSGKVSDPQHLAIQGAKVSLHCSDSVESRLTDHQGSFSFTRESFAENCKIRVVQRGFAIFEHNVARQRVWNLELRLAEVRQNIVVNSDKLPQDSLASTSLSADELRKVSNDSDVLIRYAKDMAGIARGADSLYVDGMPASHPPPAGAIQSIIVEHDSFSAEFSDGDSTRIEVVTKPGERQLRLSGGGLSLGPREHDALNPHLTSTNRAGNFGLMGPVPHLPLVFTSDAYFNEQRAAVPIEAVVPAVPQSTITSVNSAPTTNLSGSFRVGADYSKGEALHVNSSLSLWAVKDTNMNVSGLTLPQAGVRLLTSLREMRTTLRKSGASFVYDGGLVADWCSADWKANSNEMGISVVGAFTAGGAPIKEQSSQCNKWNLKNVVEFNAARRPWRAGAAISRAEEVRSTTPDPFGYIQFASLQDYVSSATTGAATGTGFLTQGHGSVRYISNTAAPFVEGELLHSATVVVRGGLRADYQTGGGALLSPRLSANASVLHGLVVRAGAGMFVQDWSNDIFLRVMENDGQHLRQLLIPEASLTEGLSAGGGSRSTITAKVAPSLTPVREWIAKGTVERPLKNLVPGVEYTWTEGSHFLGSERLSSIGGWTDLLESNRALRKHQLHIRAQYKFAGQSVTAHYEWIRSYDNTDGPFSFPQISGDLKDEWSRSSGVSPRDFTMVGNFQIRGGVSVNVAGSWRSPAPYNITTGLDPLHNGFFNDRGGLARNSGTGGEYRNLSIYGFRRFRIPGFARESKHMYANLGLQAEHLLGNKNYTALELVKSSPLFGQPLSAFPGRSLRLSLALGN